MVLDISWLFCETVHRMRTVSSSEERDLWFPECECPSEVLALFRSLERCETAMVTFSHFFGDLWSNQMQSTSCALTLRPLCYSTMPLSTASVFGNSGPHGVGVDARGKLCIYSEVFGKDSVPIKRIFTVCRNCRKCLHCSGLVASSSRCTLNFVRCSANCGPATRLRERSLGRFLIPRSFRKSLGSPAFWGLSCFFFLRRTKNMILVGKI